jgi:hypothetical protein
MFNIRKHFFKLERVNPSPVLWYAPVKPATPEEDTGGGDMRPVWAKLA